MDFATECSVDGVVYEAQFADWKDRCKGCAGDMSLSLCLGLGECHYEGETCACCGAPTDITLIWIKRDAPPAA